MKAKFENNILYWNERKIAFNAEIVDTIEFKDQLIVLTRYHHFTEFLHADIKTKKNRNIICLNPDLTVKWEITDLTEMLKYSNGKKLYDELPYLRMYFNEEQFICENLQGGGELIDPETGIRLGLAFEGR